MQELVGIESTKETGPSRYNRTDTHMDFQKLGQHAQSLDRSKEHGQGDVF